MNIDPWNYTEEELRRWAYEGDVSSVPDQDWGLSVGSSGYDKAILEMANDSTCTNQDYMILCLYFIVGDFVRAGCREDRKQIVGSIIEEGRRSEINEVKKWADESQNLIRNPNDFEYEYWCGRV